MYWGETKTATAPTQTTESQPIVSRATGAALSNAAIAERRPARECPRFLIVLLRALSAWGT